MCMFYGLVEFGEQVKLVEVCLGDLLFFKGSSIKFICVGYVVMVVEVMLNVINMIYLLIGRGVVIENFKIFCYFIVCFIKVK